MRRDARDPDSAYLFTSQRAAWLRQQERPDHLTVRGIEYIWKRIKQRARQDEYDFIHDITFHDLRHDFAHRARAAGWGLEEIAVYLGHQTRDGLPAIATTARYTLPSRQQLKKKLQKNKLLLISRRSVGQVANFQTDSGEEHQATTAGVTFLVLVVEALVGAGDETYEWWTIQ